MGRPVPAAGLVALVLAALVGCGGEPTEDYCEALSERREQIAEMVESESPSALLDNLPMLRDLAEQSPDDLTDEWQTYLGALEGLDAAIEDAGVEASDFEGGRPPADLSEADRKAIADAAGQITTEEVVQAAAGIEQQARDVCKINLGL
jgi:hypothetical protein